MKHKKQSPLQSLFLRTSMFHFYHFVGISIVILKILFPQLTSGAISMSHLDPSDIIVKEMPSSIIRSVVLFSLLISTMITLFHAVTIHMDIKNMMDIAMLYVSFLILGTFIMVLVAILCGASPKSLSNLESTFESCIFFVSVGMTSTWIPIALIQEQEKLNGTDKYIYLFRSAFLRVYTGQRYPTPSKKKHQQKDIFRIQLSMNIIIFYTTLFGLIFSMILRTLDHGTQIQRWPTPVLMGTWIGFGIGTFICVAIDACSSFFSIFSVKKST